MTSVYPESIRKAVSLLCEELLQHYPEVFKLKLNSSGLPAHEGSSFKERMELGVYIELIKAGAFSEK